jgi:hypothetical protein
VKQQQAQYEDHFPKLAADTPSRKVKISFRMSLMIVKLQPFGIVPGDSLHELLYARNSYRNTTIAYQAV